MSISLSNKSKNIVFVCLAGALLLSIMLANKDSAKDTTGDAINLYQNFSPTISSFDSLNLINFSSIDSTKQISFSLDDDAIYKTAYISINGTAWQPITLTGTVLGGNWLQSQSSGTYTVPRTKIPNGTGSDNYIITYSCTKNISGNNITWDCHNNKWQIKTFNTTKIETGIIITPPNCTVTDYTPALNTFCGDKIVVDNCNISNVKTGTLSCTSPQVCGGNGTANVCGKPSSTGTTYYISTNGSDSAGSGTASAPWKTLAYACSHVTASGSTIHVNPGTFTETTTCNLAVGVNIEGDSSNKSIIKSHVTGEFNYLISLSSGSEGTNGSQHISGILFDGDNLQGSNAIIVNARSNVKIYGCTFQNFERSGVVFNGGVGWLDGAPTIWAKGNEFHDNIMNNCANYIAANDNGQGCLQVGATEGMLVYNNIITQNQRGTGLNGWPIKFYDYGYNKGWKIYNNTLIGTPIQGSPPAFAWGFAIESWNSLGGFEIYNNTIKGALDICDPTKGTYSFGINIHDNIIGFDAMTPANGGEGDVGIRLEHSGEYINISSNRFKYNAAAIYTSTTSGKTFNNVNIYYNIFENIGTDIDSKGWGLRQTSDDNTNTYSNWNILNNVFIANPSAGSTMYAVQIPNGKDSNINIRNNIMQGFDVSPIYGSTAVTGLSIENNIFYQNGNNNNPTYSGSGTFQNNYPGINPSFNSTTNYHLNTGSPAIDKGINVGLTKDYEGNFVPYPSGGATDIGAYEYRSTVQTCTDTCLSLGNLCGIQTICQKSVNCGACTFALRTFYIDASTGSDSTGNGSVAKPWKSLYYACTRATTRGDLIHVNAGAYKETQTCNLAVGVSIEGEGNMSIIKSDISGGLTVLGGTPTIALYGPSEGTNGNQSISYIKMDGDGLNASSAIRITQRSNVAIHHNTFVDFKIAGIQFNGAGGDGEPTSKWAIGNKFYNNIVIDCSGWIEEGKWALGMNGQDGMLVYNNYMDQTSRPAGQNGYLIKSVEGYNKGVKIYNNTFNKAPYYPGTFDFAIEQWNPLGGMEIYDNVMTGSVDIVGATNTGKLYPYSVYIHDNIIGPAQLSTYQGVRGVLLEVSNYDVIIERNHIKNVCSGVYLDQISSADHIENLNVRYNIFENIGIGDGGLSPSGWGIDWTDEDYRNHIVNNVSIDNNVFIGHTGGENTMYGIGIPDIGTATNVHIRNNIVKNFNNAPIAGYGEGVATIDGLSISNNIFFSNGNNNAIKYDSIIMTNKIEKNNTIIDPMFVDSSHSNFHLKSNSSAIDKGISISGLDKDFEGTSVPQGSAPDIGAYEYK